MARRRSARRRRPAWLRAWLWIAIPIALLSLAVWQWGRVRPQDLPWTPLDLSDPIGLSTGRKLTALTGDAPRCRALLRQAGVAFTPMPAHGTAPCRYADGLRLGGRARTIGFRPEGPILSCPVAAGLALWEWHVVQPAARKHLGARVTAFDQMGSYNCRRIAGSRAWSEHATADAVDIAGFRLDDGRRISLVADWDGTPDRRAFLRAVRDGACDLFSTVLSPDYNAAHRDHLHLDQAERGKAGWRACR